MNKEELSEWFWKKLNSCCPVYHLDYPDSVFWFYDEKIIRKIKLCKLNNQKINFNIKFSNNCLFEQNNKECYLYCDFEKIWTFFHKNNDTGYREIQKSIKNILIENPKLSKYTPLMRNLIWTDMMYENRSLSLITDI